MEPKQMVAQDADEPAFQRTLTVLDFGIIRISVGMAPKVRHLPGIKDPVVERLEPRRTPGRGKLKVDVHEDADWEFMEDCIANRRTLVLFGQQGEGHRVRVERIEEKHTEAQPDGRITTVAVTYLVSEVA